MAKAAVEQPVDEAKQVEDVSIKKPPTVSNTDEPVSEVKGEDGETPSKTYSEEEHLADLEERVEKEAQAIASKSTQTYETTTRELKQKLAALEAETAKAKRETELRQIEGKEQKEWADEGVPESAIRSFQQERRAFNTEVSEKNKWIGDVQTAYKAFEVDKVNTHALKLAIQYGLENGPELIKGLDSLVEKIKVGKTDSERELLALRESLKKGEKKPLAKKPDSSLSSAPGGIDMSKASPEEKVDYGLAKLAREK